MNPIEELYRNSKLYHHRRCGLYRAYMMAVHPFGAAYKRWRRELDHLYRWTEFAYG